MKLFNNSILLATLVLASSNVADAQSLVRGERSLQKKPDGPGPGGPAGLAEKDDKMKGERDFQLL